MLGAKKKEGNFFKLLDEFAEKIVVVGENFVELVHNYEDIGDKIANLKVLETECDMQAHKIFAALNNSVTTPYNREDIYSMVKEMDDIVDSMEEVANSFKMFEIKSISREVLDMADFIMDAVKELKVLFEHMPDDKKSDVINRQVIEVNRIENEGDVLYRRAITKLFKEEKDPIELIKWKNILEQLEDSLDACENVANIVEGLMMKYA